MDGAFNCPTHVTLADFTLHGLWPENTDGSWPCDCPGPAFDEAALKPISADMNTFWPSLSGPSPTFWAHEWTTHGTCSSDVFPTQLGFFNGTLGLRAKYSIVDALKAAGIVPGAKSFAISAFNKALTTAYGHSALLTCDAKGNVETAVMCVGKDLALMDCPANIPRKCASTVYLPSSY
jgi:ribonuclease T2